MLNATMAVPYSVAVTRVLYPRTHVECDALMCRCAIIVMVKARETRELAALSLDGALVVPATSHCRTMCENSFLSHWDIAGRKPYQRYADFAYGQHVSEVVFGFDVHEATENEVWTAQ